MSRENLWKLFSTIFDTKSEDAEVVATLFETFVKSVTNKNTDTNKVHKCELCSLSKQKSDEFLNHNNSAYDAAIDYAFWNDKCKQNCMYNEFYD